MKIRKNFPRLALGLALLMLVWFLVAMVGAKMGLIDKLFAFGVMTAQWGSMMAMGVAVIALAALITAAAIKPRQGWLAAVIALALPLAILAGFMQLQARAGSVPFIYDITTNTADAPMYSSAMMKARERSGANPLIDFARPLGQQDKWQDREDFANVTAAALIARGYPDLETLTVSQPREDVLKAVQEAMGMRGYTGITVDEEAGIVEGTDVVFWYDFEDDIVARIRPGAESTSVDFRSTSRVGTSDLGVNAQRIAELGTALRERLAEKYSNAATTEAPTTETPVHAASQSDTEIKNKQTDIAPPAQ